MISNDITDRLVLVDDQDGVSATARTVDEFRKRRPGAEADLKCCATSVYIFKTQADRQVFEQILDESGIPYGNTKNQWGPSSQVFEIDPIPLGGREYSSFGERLREVGARFDRISFEWISEASHVWAIHVHSKPKSQRGPLPALQEPDIKAAQACVPYIASGEHDKAR